MIPAPTQFAIEEHLNGIAAHFKPGAKLTLLVRNDVGEGFDADAVFTNDQLPEAIAALQKRHDLAETGDG